MEYEKGGKDSVRKWAKSDDGCSTKFFILNEKFIYGYLSGKS